MTVHTVTVTALDNTHLDLPDDQYVDGVQFTVECPGCDLWEECGTCRKDGYTPTEDEDDEGEYTRHGVHHQNHEYMWTIPMAPDACAVNFDSVSDAMQEAAEEAGLGVHQIELDYEGDGCWTASRVIPPEEAARIEARAQELYQEGLPSRAPWADQQFGVREYFRSKARKEEHTKENQK